MQRLVLEGFLVLVFKVCLFLFYMFFFFMFVCVHGDQKRVSGLMELELQMVISCHVVAGS